MDDPHGKQQYIEPYKARRHHRNVLSLTGLGHSKCYIHIQNIKDKYASYPDWRISPHDDPRRLHSQWWLTRRSVVSGQFVTPGSRLSNPLSPHRIITLES